jgi:DNA-binding NarL/FixJ family response regulator
MSQSAPITIVIADDQARSRAGLQRLLAASASFRTVGESADWRQVLDLLDTFQPDILLLNIRLSGLQGLMNLATLRAQSPHTKILLLTDRDDEITTSEALHHGAYGVVSKEGSPTILCKAIRAVHAGELWAPRKVLADFLMTFRQQRAGPPTPLAAWKSLTTREREIVQGVRQGLINQEIAAQLGISVKTVKTHLHVIFRKLGLRRRYELLRLSFPS